jgi:hypothetical protein
MHGAHDSASIHGAHDDARMMLMTAHCNAPMELWLVRNRRLERLGCIACMLPAGLTLPLSGCGGDAERGSDTTGCGCWGADLPAQASGGCWGATASFRAACKHARSGYRRLLSCSQQARSQWLQDQGAPCRLLLHAPYCSSCTRSGGSEAAWRGLSAAHA